MARHGTAFIPPSLVAGTTGSAQTSYPVGDIKSGDKGFQLAGRTGQDFKRTEENVVKLKLMGEAPRDGTPIVVVYRMTDEGDFIGTVFWTKDGEDGYWDTTSDGEFCDSDFLGWLGTAEEVYKIVAADPAQ